MLVAASPVEFDAASPLSLLRLFCFFSSLCTPFGAQSCSHAVHLALSYAFS